LTFPWRNYVYRISIKIILMIWYMQVHFSPAPFPSWIALFNPQDIFYYIGMFIRLIDIFSTREKCTGASG